MNQSFSLTIVVPAYNEKDNIKGTITNLIKILHDCNVDWELILVDDGSMDETGSICDLLAKENMQIKVIHHDCNMGIGRCFRDGVKAATKDVITWIPADGENDFSELFKYFLLLEHVDIIVPYVVNIGVRSWGRRLLSAVYLWIINLSFGTMFNYTNGNIIYKRKVLEGIKPDSRGFFFQSECLIRAIRAGFIFAEVPVRLKERKRGLSKALTTKSFYLVMGEFIKFFFAVHIFRRVGRVTK